MAGPTRHKRTFSKNKGWKKLRRTRRRAKDIDQVQDELKQEESGKRPLNALDHDLPGAGQFECLPCARFFTAQDVLDRHVKTKQHKRRVKRAAEDQYTQAEADAAAGLGRERRIRIIVPAPSPAEDIQMAS